MRWAYNMGLQGLDFEEQRDKAADAGTVAHALVEAHIKKQPQPIFNVDKEIETRGRSAFQQYLNWERHSRLEIIESEISLVSETYQFGGTIDAIGRLEAALCLPDWKSSNGLYSDALIQIAAYKNLWEENFPDRPITGGFHLCRFSKDWADFEHRHFGNLDDAWELFKHYRVAYDLDKRLQKRLK